MLGAALFSAMKANYETVIDTLGESMTFTQAKPPNTTFPIVAGMKIAGLSDVSVTNALGIGARVITVKASNFLMAPEKFDKFTAGGETYVADSVHPVHLNAALIGYRIYVKGK